MHVMIDLETFGLGPTAAIVQIGAAGFTLGGGLIEDKQFEATVALQSSLLSGGTIDQSTISWWKTQRQDSIYQISFKAQTLEDTLFAFTKWFPEDEVLEGVWSHGAAFDVPILEGAYTRLGSPPPWHYRKVRDTRTLLWLAEERGWESDKPKPSHTARLDCLDQIFELRSAYNYLDTMCGTQAQQGVIN